MNESDNNEIQKDLPIGENEHFYTETEENPYTKRLRELELERSHIVSHKKQIFTVSGIAVFIISILCGIGLENLIIFLGNKAPFPVYMPVVGGAVFGIGWLYFKNNRHPFTMGNIIFLSVVGLSYALVLCFGGLNRSEIFNGIYQLLWELSIVFALVMTILLLRKHHIISRAWKWLKENIFPFFK